MRLGASYEVVMSRGSHQRRLSQMFSAALGWAGPRLAPRWDFEWLYARDVDPWACSRSDYEATKYTNTLAAVPPVVRALEIGCGEGLFTVALAERTTEVVAVDLSATATARAGVRCRLFPHVTVQCLDVVIDSVPGSFQLIVTAEVLYYLGGGRRYIEVCQRLVDLIDPGGYLLAVNPVARAAGLHGPFQKMGMEIARQDVHCGQGRDYVVALFRKRDTPRAASPFE